MAAPAFGTAGTYLTGGTRTTSSVAVPASVASGDTIIVDLYLESSAAVTPPAGFQELTPAPATTGTVTTFRRFIKRATGADSGTYAFTHASAFTEGVATRYTGAGTAGALYDVANSASRSSNGTTTPAVTVTTTGTDRLLVWSASSVGAGAWTPPASYTERVDTSGEVSVATISQASAGSSGSVTGTGPSGFMCAWLVALSSSILIDATTSTTTTSATATAQLVGVATSSTTISATATGVLTGGGTSSTTVSATATARTVGTATSSTTISATAEARLAGTATSSTTISATATARLVGVAASSTTISATATAQALGTATSATNIHVLARARDANLPLPVAPLRAAAADSPPDVTMARGWSAADPDASPASLPTAASGWSGTPA